MNIKTILKIWRGINTISEIFYGSTNINIDKFKEQIYR